MEEMVIAVFVFVVVVARELMGVLNCALKKFAIARCLRRLSFVRSVDWI